MVSSASSAQDRFPSTKTTAARSVNGCSSGPCKSALLFPEKETGLQNTRHAGQDKPGLAENPRYAASAALLWSLHQPALILPARGLYHFRQQDRADSPLSMCRGKRVVGDT